MAFDKFKQISQMNKMRQQAKQLQKELEKEEETFDEDGLKIKVNGAQEILYLEIDGEKRDDVMKAINKVMKDVQKKAV